MEVGAIIISPTRELAIQISEILEEFLKRIPLLKQVLLVGGVTLQKDAEKLKKGANIIVATPGRLKDILSNYINLGLCIKSLVQYLVFFHYPIDSISILSTCYLRLVRKFMLFFFSTKLYLIYLLLLLYQ